MTTDLVDPAAISEMIRSTFEPGWNAEAAAAAAAPPTVEAAIAAARRGMMALSATEPDLDGLGSRTLVNALADIGCKIAPAMAQEEGQRWRVAMLKALSDLPGKVAVQAAQQAMHVPMRFLNEVELAIREKAEALLSRQRVALIRLEALLREIQRAAQPKIEQRSDPLTAAEIRALKPEFRRLGLRQGWITDEEVAAAFAEAGLPIDEEASR